MRSALAIALGVTLLAGPEAAHAGDDWSQWRGPNFNGSTESSELPVEWGDDKNLVWKVAMPGPSAATPAVAGDAVFLTAMDRTTQTITAMCLDRRTGETRWSHELGTGRTGPRRGFENSRTECSPITDGTGVYFLLGTGRLVGYELDGTERWTRDLVKDHGSFNIDWGYASSPLLFDGTIYIQVLRSGESFLLAIDPATGADRWRHVREDDAEFESEQAYTSPIPYNHKGTWEILVLGADCLTAHDPKTGAEQWRWCGLNPNNRGNFRVISSAVAGDDGLIYVTQPQGNPMHALEVSESGASIVWTIRRPTPDVCTPLFYKGRLYVLDGKRRQRLACVEPKTGEIIWAAELETQTHVRSSPTAADDKIYVMDAEGVVNVVAAGDEFKALGRMELDSYPSRASIAIQDGQLLIRTADHLYCVGKSATTKATPGESD